LVRGREGGREGGVWGEWVWVSVCGEGYGYLWWRRGRRRRRRRGGSGWRGREEEEEGEVNGRRLGKEEGVVYGI